MRILFVYTDINTMGLGTKTYHLGIGMLSAVLKSKGHRVDIVCMWNKFRIKPLLRKIINFKPDIIALTSDTTQFIYIKKIIQHIASFNIFTILGGVHASLCPRCIEEVQGLDAVCIGEGEYSMLELVDNFDKRPKRYDIDSIWFKVKDKNIINKTRAFINNLDELPFADRKVFDYQRIIDSDYGRASFMLSRGCPYNCTFCASPSMGKLQEGRYTRFMSVNRAIEELKHLKRNYRFKSIFFADDTFTINKDYVIDFSQQYKKNIDVPFEANSRIETTSPEIFKTLKEAGCFKIHMGIESGDEEFRNRILNRRMTNGQIIDAFDMARKAGLLTKSYNIVGFPYETFPIHQNTVELNRRINPDGHVCYIFQPYPGTKLYETCETEGFINNRLKKDNIISRRNTILNMPDFKPEEIVRCQRNFSFQIYKKVSLKKALLYRLYYSRYAESFIRIFYPFRRILRRFVLK